MDRYGAVAHQYIHSVYYRTWHSESVDRNLSHRGMNTETTRLVVSLSL